MKEIVRYVFGTCLFIFSFVFCAFVVFAEEAITMSTYYPAPRGVFKRTVTTTLGVGDINKSGTIDSADAPDPANSAQRGDLWVAGDVGIGAVKPRSQLDVKGAAIIGGNYSGNNIITAPTSGLLVEGRVGIGTTAPSANLEVNNTLVFKPASAPAYTSVGAVYYDAEDNVLKYYDGTWKTIGAGGQLGNQVSVKSRFIRATYNSAQNGTFSTAVDCPSGYVVTEVRFYTDNQATRSGVNLVGPEIQSIGLNCTRFQ